MKQKIKRFDLRTIALLFMPFMIFFSFYPMLNFGQSHGMHFEISLLEIYLVFFALVNIKSIWHSRHALAKNKAVWLILAFCIISSISLFWTSNFVKGLLISGVTGLLFVCFLSLLTYKNLQKLLPTLTKILIMSACLVSIFALFQMFAEVIGLPQNVSLLCDGCRANQFGFARVTGFAIEPQFLGSLLLIPIFILLHRFIKNKKWCHQNLCLVLLLIAIFLTMSRGAIYALAIGVIIFVIIFRRQLKKVLLSLVLILGSFLLALIVQGLSAQLNPNIDDNFHAAISRSVHQLSLGIIDLRPQDVTVPTDQTPSDAPAQDGYVEESTETRALLSKLALEAWAKTPTNIIFGTGVGSTGFILHHYFPDQIRDTEITQNAYVEILLEHGLIGLAIFGTLIFFLFRLSTKHKVLMPIFAAFLVQWFFFSGYPNALHIYLFFFVCTASLLYSIDSRRRPCYD